VARDGKRQPLLPGMELRPGDQIITGVGSRIAVKLGKAAG